MTNYVNDNIVSDPCVAAENLHVNKATF